MPRRGPIIRQHATHARLIGHSDPNPAEGEDRPTLDAIVVPASRPAHNLDHAITLARAVRCHLVILCSRDTHAAGVHDLLATRSFSAATVIEIPPRYSHEFFRFETTDWVRQRLPIRDSDLSVKRNVGLVLARMLGWKRIFFMDDDIRDLGATALLATVSLLADGQPPEQRYYTAGMSAAEFPDNSVVCHARRAIGEFQDVFVSGSALAVDCTISFAFFPDIYNEDWLFFYRDTAEGRLGTSGHTATQLRYDPFANPQRAAAQEFGDVIAEGLYALLDEGLGAELATAERWDQFLRDRKRILDEIIDRSGEAPQEIRDKMTLTVATARQCLEKIRPDMCVDYVQRWRRDLGQWEMTLKRIPEAVSIADALGKLGLLPAGAGDTAPQDRPPSMILDRDSIGSCRWSAEQESHLLLLRVSSERSMWLSGRSVHVGDPVEAGSPDPPPARVRVRAGPRRYGLLLRAHAAAAALHTGGRPVQGGSGHPGRRLSGGDARGLTSRRSSRRTTG